MQVVCKCKYCGHIFMSENEDDLCLEIDFMEEEIRFVCREKGCRRNNKINFAEKSKTAPLPGIIGMR